ncbi:hypothetical protein D3C77_668940 [compost metagenome]
MAMNWMRWWRGFPHRRWWCRRSGVRVPRNDRFRLLRIVLQGGKKEPTFSPLGLDHYLFRSRDARRPDDSMRYYGSAMNTWKVRQGMAGKRGEPFVADSVMKVVRYSEQACCR